MADPCFQHFFLLPHFFWHCFLFFFPLIFPPRNDPLLMSLTNPRLTFFVLLSVSPPLPLCGCLPSPFHTFYLFPALIINSCDAAQQSLTEWYTSTITNKPKYLNSAGMIGIDDYRAGRERGRWGFELPNVNVFLFHQRSLWFTLTVRLMGVIFRKKGFLQSQKEYSDRAV